MRVMVLTQDYPPNVWSGISAAVEHQCHALAKLKVDVHVLATGEHAGAARVQSSEGITVYPLNTESCPVDPAQFDLVHLHSVALGELALELAHRFDLPLVYSAHSLLSQELRGLSGMVFWVQAQDQLLLGSDWVIFLSTPERAAALARFPQLASHSSVIPNGVPLVAAPDRSAAGPIVFAGRFARQKGIPLLAAIVRRLLAKHDLQFVFAGGHGDPLGHHLVAQLVADYPQACSLSGWLGRDALDDLFARASLVLIPSEYEPFSMVALEAMRLGTPVLAGAVGGLCETVGAGSGGKLVYSREPDAWCEAVVEILETPELSGALRRQGPDWVAAHFHPGRLAAQMLENVYQPCVRARQDKWQ